DLLGHLGGADGRRAHHGLHRVLASLEVDRVTTERLLLCHSLSPPSSECGIRRPAPPVGPRVLSPGYEGAQGKNTIPRGPSTRGRYRVGVYPRGCRIGLAATDERRHHVAGEPRKLLLEFLGAHALRPVNHHVLETWIAGFELLDLVDDD